MTEDSAFDVAEGVRNGPASEAAFRAAASRYYLSVFAHIKKHGLAPGFAWTNSGGDHQALIKHCLGSPDATTATVGRNLRELRRLRNIADYDFDKKFNRGMADHAGELASEVIHDLWPASTP